MMLLPTIIYDYQAFNLQINTYEIFNFILTEAYLQVKVEEVYKTCFAVAKIKLNLFLEVIIT